MTFDEFKKFISKIRQPKVAPGVVRIKIRNNSRIYRFNRLRPFISCQPFLTGFSLSNYHNSPVNNKQKYKTSIFHDEKNIDIKIYKSEFKRAYVSAAEDKCIVLYMKTWQAHIYWENIK